MPVIVQDIDDRLNVAKKIICEAVANALDIRRQGLETSLKSSERDRPSFLTQADKAVEEHLVRAWMKEFPYDGIIGEEDGTRNRPGRSDICIIIDPIDGTVPFSRGIETYALALAICIQGVPVASVIWTQGRLFWADTLNSMKSFRSRAPDPENPLRWVVANEMLQLLKDGTSLMKAVWEVAGQHLTLGSAISTGVMVATGQVQAYMNSGVCIWDIAPLVPFAKVAGLRLTRWDGTDPFPHVFDRVIADPTKYAKGSQCFDLLMAAELIHAALLLLVHRHACEREKALYGT